MKLDKPLNKMTEEERKAFLRSKDGRIMMNEIKKIINKTKQNPDKK